jgi:hypothetical protein
MVGEDGKVAMASPYKVARADGGSGEVFRALKSSGTLRHMSKAGVRCLDVHAMGDNAMARIADATFIGYCHSIGLDCAAKVIDPDAAQMTTYGYAMAAGVLPGGGAGEDGPVMEALPGMMPAIGQYYFSMRWVREVEKALEAAPLALYKMVPAPVPAGAKGTVPGYALQRSVSDFVLGCDSLVASQQMGAVVVEPSEEFAAVWGDLPFYAPDTDTAAVEDLLLLHTSWVEAAGGALADGEEGVVEVSPLVSYCGEELETVGGGASSLSLSLSLSVDRTLSLCLAPHTRTRPRTPPNAHALERTHAHKRTHDPTGGQGQDFRWRVRTRPAGICASAGAAHQRGAVDAAARGRVCCARGDEAGKERSERQVSGAEFRPR